VKRLLVIRHGESIWNAEGRWQGWANIPLSAAGEEQAKAAGERLAALSPLRFSAIHASDLSRAHQTAEIISAYVDCSPVTAIPGLRERHVGEFQGVLSSDIAVRWPHLAEAWNRGIPFDPPGGEVASEFQARILAAVHELLAAAEEESTLLAVSHGGVIRALENHLGVAPARIHNLSGRWLHAEDGRLSAGDPFAL
jgi:broad specificity phosphatase PhoE